MGNPNLISILTSDPEGGTGGFKISTFDMLLPAY